MSSGYHDCPCRDCFEIAIGDDEDGSLSLCNACEKAGCDGDGECCSPHAYNAHCGDVDCCGALHTSPEIHAPSEDWIAACPECNPPKVIDHA